MNQTYRRLYILICNIGMPGSSYGKFSIFLLLCRFVLVSPFSVADIPPSLCMYVYPMLSLFRTHVPQNDLKWRQTVVRLKQIYECKHQFRSPTRIYVESVAHIQNTMTQTIHTNWYRTRVAGTKE